VKGGREEWARKEEAERESIFDYLTLSFPLYICIHTTYIYVYTYI